MSKSGKLERDIQDIVWLEADKYGAILWRNNTGAYKVGNRYVRFGLCVGSSDLIGLTRDGRFLAIEVKRGNKKPEPEQQKYIDFVNAKGGLAFFINENNISDIEKYLK